MAGADEPFMEVDRDLIVDRIYELALEPTSLDAFIDFWHDSNLVDHFAKSEQTPPEGVFTNHLERAQTILQRGEDTHLDLSEYLKPYENLAAFVVSEGLNIIAVNESAMAAFDVKPGNKMERLKLPDPTLTQLIKATEDVLHQMQMGERLLKEELSDKGGTVLFRVLHLATQHQNGPAALIVSTRFHWKEELSKFLGTVYQLTHAEQSVVKLLVEGFETKNIATSRDTSEGTVRAQIKSITAKMNAKSQTDIVRQVMSLGEFPKGENKKTASKPALTALSNNWFETEVWKPFRSIALPDGRTLTFHDMGPVTGNPVLYTHTGSCLVRWPRSMIQLAFEKNLRIICPIRAGYGHSDRLRSSADPIETSTQDTLRLLEHLDIPRLPYVAHGTDFPLAAHFMANHNDMVSEMIGIGSFPRLPGDRQVVCAGRWQSFFVATARNAPHLVHLASSAVMAMSKRIGSDAMLRQLCKDQPSDLALLEVDEMQQILAANISLMAGKSTNAGRAFAMEYVAYQTDWTDNLKRLSHMPMHISLAEEDPTIDWSLMDEIRETYPWIQFEIVRKAGLAMLFQKYEMLLPILADAAKRATLDCSDKVDHSN